MTYQTYQKIRKDTFLVPFLVKGDIFTDYKVLYPIYTQKRLQETRQYYLDKDKSYSILYMTIFITEKEIEKLFDRELEMYG